MSRLLVTHADGCLVVVADAHLVRGTAHFQTGIFGGVRTYGERQGANFIFEWQKAGLVETCGGGEARSCARNRGAGIESNIKTLFCFFFQPADSCVALTEAGRKIMSWRKKVRGRKNGKRHEVNVEFSTVLSCLMRTVLSKRRPHLLPNQSPTPTWRLWQRGTDG